MPDHSDPNSPFLVLEQDDPRWSPDEAPVRIEVPKTKPGIPPTILWRPQEFGRATDRPSDMLDYIDYDDFRKYNLTDPHIGGAIMSEALFKELDSLVPGTSKTMEVILAGPDSLNLNYVVMFPLKQLEAKKIDDAKPGDLQWGPVAFDEKDAPGELFALEDGGYTLIVVSKRVSEKLNLEKFPGLKTFAFHRTPPEGGAMH